MTFLDPQVIGMITGAALTILIFSYLLGDTLFYRLALHLFTGALVGYFLGVVVREVLFKTAFGGLLQDPVLAIPLLMGVGLFFFKSIRRLAYIGNIFLAFLIGVGVMVTLTGVLRGTLLPQLEATSRAFDEATGLGMLNSLLMLVGTVCTLMAFHFAARKQSGLAGLWSRLVGLAGQVGRWFLLVLFGVAFAGALTASLSILIGRVQYILQVLQMLGILGS